MFIVGLILFRVKYLSNLVQQVLQNQGAKAANVSNISSDRIGHVIDNTNLEDLCSKTDDEALQNLLMEVDDEEKGILFFFV